MHDTILESIVLYLNLKMAELWIEQYFLIEFMKGIPSIRRICVAIFICVRQGIRKNIDSISPLCIMLFNVNLVDRYLDIIPMKRDIWIYMLILILTWNPFKVLYTINNWFYYPVQCLWEIQVETLCMWICKWYVLRAHDKTISKFFGNACVWEFEFNYLNY